MARWFDVQVFAEAGLNTQWLQESCSYTQRKNTVRGLHMTLPPSLKGKTITALQGRMQRISVDLGQDSPTFPQRESIILDGEQHNTLYAAKGFAHGCLSPSDACCLLLRADSRYSEVHGTGIV